VIVRYGWVLDNLDCGHRRHREAGVEVATVPDYSSSGAVVEGVEAGTETRRSSDHRIPRRLRALTLVP